MDFKTLFLLGVLAFAAAGCVTEEPAGPGSAEVLDLSTREYPYIGYFTAMRGAIFERWVYPLEAVQKNHEGAVRVEITIKKSGRLEAVRVVKSSSHQELDEAIVKAIKGAAPYLPLPDEFDREAMTVGATFTYVRSAYSADPPPAKGKRRKPGPKKGLGLAAPP